jgi:hypothetical protein
MNESRLIRLIKIEFQKSKTWQVALLIWPVASDSFGSNKQNSALRWPNGAGRRTQNTLRRI